MVLVSLGGPVAAAPAVPLPNNGPAPLPSPPPAAELGAPETSPPLAVASEAPAPPPVLEIDPYDWPVLDAPVKPRPMDWTDREKEAIAYTEAATGRALAILSETRNDPEAQRAQLVALLSDAFDVDRLARILLGRHIAEVNDRQMSSYSALVPEYLVNLYTNQVQSIIRADQLTVDAHERRDGVFIVRTALPGEMGVKPVYVDWRLSECAEGGLKFIDVSVDGVSLAVAKRNEFDAVIGKWGFDHFLDMLHEQAGFNLPTPLNAPVAPQQL